MKRLWLLAALVPLAHTERVIVRPAEIQGVLVNPGMGITTFQRYNGEPLYPGLRWSEAGPTEALAPASTKPVFPETTIAYCRWHWITLEPEQFLLLHGQPGRDAPGSPRRQDQPN